MPPVPLRRDRDFMLLQVGQLLSNAGSQATAIAYPLLALALTHSAVKAGLVSFARTLPLAVLSIPAGVAADRFNRRTLMIVADTVRAAAIGTLAVSLVAFDPPFWLIPCIAFLEGTGTAIFGRRRSRGQSGPSSRQSSCPKRRVPRAAGPPRCALSAPRSEARSSRWPARCPSWPTQCPTPSRPSRSSSCGSVSRRSVSTTASASGSGSTRQ